MMICGFCGYEYDDFHCCPRCGCGYGTEDDSEPDDPDYEDEAWFGFEYCED